ncbi:hypothetical protein CPB83DRAFT_898901 [Crepidotus variabilis]|uniref:Uncharacterized protein n=1 Tax=Crepidotus variabilis TaxID=179855 RepID=A0A9P6JJZ8_9AGAR|nr:hypothetical protein CPB83DRAFT_898901 [Crepidotus variabilis]
MPSCRPSVAFQQKFYKKLLSTPCQTNHPRQPVKHQCRSHMFVGFGDSPPSLSLRYGKNLDDTSKWSVEEQSIMVRKWFQRTGSHSLAFHLHTPSNFRDVRSGKENFVKRFLNPLRLILLRVKDFSIGAPKVADILPLFQGKISGLRKLAICGGLGKEDNNATISPFLNPENTLFSQVDQLSLDSLFSILGFAQYTFPWSTLTSLEIRQGISERQYRQIMVAYSQLVRAAFLRQNPFDDFDPPQLDPFPCKPMTALALRVHHSIPNSELLAICDMDNLRTLEINHIDSYVDVETKYSRFEGRLSSVCNLSLSGDWFDSADIFLEMLDDTSELKNLYINLQLDPAKIFEILSVLETDGVQVSLDLEAKIGFYDFNPYRDGLCTEYGLPFMLYLSSLTFVFPNEITNLCLVIIQLKKLLLAKFSYAKQDDFYFLHTLQVAVTGEKSRKAIREAVEPFVAEGLIFEFVEHSYSPQWFQSAHG